MADTKTTAEILGREIANLGYPTGMGMAPHPETLARIAAAVTASHEARIAELEEALRPMLQRFELYAGPDDIHAGEHDKALLTLARRALHTEGE